MKTATIHFSASASPLDGVPVDKVTLVLHGMHFIDMPTAGGVLITAPLRDGKHVALYLQTSEFLTIAELFRNAGTTRATAETAVAKARNGKAQKS